MTSFGNLLPSYLYSTSSTSSVTQLFRDPSTSVKTPTMLESKPTSTSVSTKPFIPSIVDKPIVLHSGRYYYYCAIGGILSCGLTHMGVTPLDVVKCNMQTDPTKYRSIPTGFKIVIAEQGVAGIFRGWVPTLVGYSMQGACKFGFYEYFKKTYSDMFTPENAVKYQTGIYLAGSASAEVIADVALCPMEAVKVKVQTTPGFAKGLMDGFPRFVALEGYAGLFKGIVPLWGRQVPYTMMKFACFENTVQALYQYVIPKPKDKCSKPEQIGVSFIAGYIAGVFCAVVSHPADNLVSKLNAQKGAAMGEIIQEMGWFALFTRGLPLRIIMIGTLTGLQWGIYDGFKVAVGLQSAGGIQKKPVEQPIPALATK
eukprot:g545.t1